MKTEKGNEKQQAEADVIRHYEGIDMKEVYRSKPLAYKAVKRLFDIIASALILIILSPLFLILAILIKKEDGGPVFHSGMRWGKDLQFFPMHKFRTMCPDAEKLTDKYLKEEDKNGMAFKIENDPRITRIGRFLYFPPYCILPIRNPFPRFHSRT